MLKNLKRKLYFLFVSSIMFVFTIVFFLLTRENIENMQNAELSDINRQATILTLLFENSTNYMENLEICEKKYNYAFRLFTEQNELLYESCNEDTTKTIDIFLEIQKNSERIDKGEAESNHSFQSGTITFSSEKGRTYHGVLCSIYTDTGYVNLVIVKEKSGLTDFLPAIIHYFLIWFIVLIAVLFVSVLIIRQAIKPAEKTMQSQKNFIAAVSHELKTPLAVILSAADTIEASSDCTVTIKNHASLIEAEISRMTRLIQDLLLLSSIDAGNWIYNKSEINVDTLLVSLYDKFVNICNQKSIDLQIHMPEECFPSLFSDEDRLNQIISILLDNAVSYSPEHSVILLDASIRKNYLTISIIDHGIGISEEDKHHIFDRFYRCDKSRTQKGHYGLGLSVANELISLLAGKIYLNDTPGGGCTFTIVIPWNIAE
ncbi:MAG: HAMP domain-containing histidine kinase [Lachnospiraceae bacterium]|nr:HAMP domain-containing histidine kinase [Lachnospiraceae bacterium]